MASLPTAVASHCLNGQTVEMMTQSWPPTCPSVSVGCLRLRLRLRLRLQRGSGCADLAVGTALRQTSLNRLASLVGGSRQL